MPPPSQLIKLNLQELEPRDVPATWAVNLGSQGLGQTAASISGTLSLNSTLPTNSNGAVLVEADTAQEALCIAIVGTITAQANGETLTYVFGPGTLGTNAAQQMPFLYSNGILALEDMAGSATGSDWDYNDYGAYASAQLWEGPPTGPPAPPSPPPYQSPPFWNPTPPPQSPPAPPVPPAPGDPQNGTVFTARLLTPGLGFPGSPAIMAGSLSLDQRFASISGTTALIIPAVDEIDAVRLALTGTVYARLTANGRAMEHLYRAEGASITVGRSIDASRAASQSFAVEALAGRVLAAGEPPATAGATHRVYLEAMNGPNPVGINDQDYNDQFWDVRIESVPVPTVKLEILGANGAAISNLKVGKWENAFDPTQGGGAPTLKAEFIDLDPDRFNVRVTDSRFAAGGLLNGQGKPRLNGSYNPANDPTVLDKVSVYVITGVDTGAWVTLTEDNAGSGVFRSMSLLAVSNTVDDFADGDDGRVDDRTFKVQLGTDGTTINNVTFHYEYANGDPHQVTKTEKALTQKVVKLHINILKLADGTPAVSPNVVASYIAPANEIYAQVGIRFELVGQINLVNQPAGVDLTDKLDEFPGYDANGKLLMTDEEKAILGKDDYRTPPVSGSSDDIEIYYVNSLTRGSLAEAFRAQVVPDAKYADSLISAAVTPYTVLAHEIAHILLGNGDHPNGNQGVNRVNLMAFPYQVIGLTTDSRRLTAAQETLIHSVRPNLLIKL